MEGGFEPPEDRQLAERLRAAFRARAGREQLCLLSRGRPTARFTGDELEATVERDAQALAAWLGEGRGPLVLAFPAGPAFVTTMLACLLAGIVAVPVSPPRRGSASERLSHIVADCGARAVLCPPETAASVRAALGASGVPVVSWPLQAAAPPPLRDTGATLPTATAVVQYTSGSTRSPKGVAITGANILANCDLVMRSWGMDEACRFVNWMPHFHDMGLMGGTLYPLLCGGFSIQMSPYDFVRDPLGWLGAVSDWRATFSGGPAFAFAEVLRRVPQAALAGLDLSCWQRAFCGAEPVPPGLLDDFHAHLAPAGLARPAVFACYGLAEMTLFAAGLPEEEASPAELRAGSHGCRVNDELRAALAVVDPATGQALPEGAEGEIWLSGASQAAGYLNLPEETAAGFRESLDGGEPRYLRSGDLGRLEGDRLFVTGRLKDVLICHGRKMSAAEVEWLACSVEPALNPLAAAAFMEDEALSGRAVLIAETHEPRGRLADAEAARRAIRRSVLGEWGLDLVDILFLPRGRLPRTTSGKIRRAEVAGAYRRGAFAGSLEVF